MRVVYLLYCLSGFVSLGYQVAWFRIFVDRFGSTNLTFGLVICNFIGGLGIGSLVSKRLSGRLARISHLKSPLRVYGLTEILVGATALFTLALPSLPPDLWGAFPYWLDGGIYQPTIAYLLSHAAISVLCVFVPCFFMGVTFPLLCEAFRDDARFPAALYGWNTLGACTGVLACEFLLLPSIGHEGTFALMAVVNLALGLFFLLSRRLTPRAAHLQSAPITSVGVSGSSTYAISTALVFAIIGGFLTGAFEADVLRRLQFLDCRTDAAMSCISFWAILSIFAASFAVRALPRLRIGHIKIAWCLALLIYLALWQSAYELRDWANAEDIAEVIGELPPDTTGLGIPLFIQHFRYGPGAVFQFTCIFVFPAFLLMSLLLPHVCIAVQTERRHLGLVYGANTVAFCIGILTFTMIAPRVSVFYSLKLFLVVFVVLVLLLIAIPPHRRLPEWRPGLAAVLLIAGGLFTPAGFDASYLPATAPAARFPVRAMRSNGTHTTYVVDDPAGDLLYFDSHTMSGCNLPSQRYMRLMAHFPLLAHPAPRTALLICFGVGNTASAIATHDSIVAIDVVDLNDQVLATAPEFSDYNRDVVKDPRVRLLHDDGRRFLALTEKRYDLITSEPPPPMFAGMYRLYSREYYEAARSHLTESGMMTQWLPIGQMPRDVVARAISTFISVFPNSLLFVGSDINFIIMGAKSPIDLKLVETGFAASPGVPRDLQSFGIIAPLQILARIVKAGPTLHREFGDHPVVSDRGVGFGHAFIDPQDPAVITYDPVVLLQEIDLTPLACGEDLRATMLNLGLLKYVVGDFPVSALISVAARGAQGVAQAHADWRGIERYCDVAEEELQKHRYAQACQLLINALNLGEDQLPLVFERLATALFQAGKYDSALSAFQRIQSLAPHDPASHYCAGEVLCRLDRRDEAIAAFQRAIELDRGGVARFRSALGDALAATGRWAEALAAYEQALIIDSEDEAARAGRQRCLQRAESRR